MSWRILLVSLSLICTVPLYGQGQKTNDVTSLGMALDYFQSGKYHECGLILQRLDKQYKLNPRFRAYLGVCLYYDWDYRQASDILDTVIPQLTAFAPQERSVYYWTDAESHYYLKEYDKALPLYQQQLMLCQENERADAYYKIGLIAMKQEQWRKALDSLQSALVYYRTYQHGQQKRITQIRSMITDICKKLH